MFCKKCGKQLPEGSQFCTGCGAQMGEGSETETAFLGTAPSSGDAIIGMKTKLGISVGLAGAAVYFLGLFGGYLALIVAVGYILLAEKNEWLRKAAVKAAVVMFAFSIVGAIVGFLPDLTSFISQFLGIFKVRPDLSIISSLSSLLVLVVNVLEKLVMLLLGINALRQGSFTIKPIDSFVETHTDNA